jgi:hypothetical protein
MYLVDLFKRGYKVIPTVNRVADLTALPPSNRYLLHFHRAPRISVAFKPHLISRQQLSPSMEMMCSDPPPFFPALERRSCEGRSRVISENDCAVPRAQPGSSATAFRRRTSTPWLQINGHRARLNKIKQSGEPCAVSLRSRPMS